MQLPETRLKKDYKSTSKTVLVQQAIPNPIVPDGDGWKLKYAGQVTVENGTRIKYSWTWERDVPETQSDEGDYLTQELRSPR